MLKRYTIHILVIVICCLAASCRLKEDKEWDLDALVPIGHGEVSFGNIVNDTLLKENTDKSLKLVSVQNLGGTELGELLKIPDSTLEKSVSLKTLRVGERQLSRSITLGEVSHNAGITGQFILASHGKKTRIPPLSGISTGDLDIDAQSFFKSATFIDGKLRLDIHNAFPIEVTNINLKLMNKESKVVVLSDVISSLMPDQTFSKVYSLAGKTVEGNLLASLSNIGSPGSGTDSVIVDTTDAISIKISIYDMQVLEAEAIFPAQYLVNDSTNIGYNLDGAALTYMKIRSGEIVVTAQHTIEEKLFLGYSIPSATKNGVPIKEDRIMNASANGQLIKLRDNFPVDGYDVDLRGRNRDTFNSFFNTLSVRIDSTGILRHLSLKDSIYIFYGLVNVIPDYAKGYLGQKTFSIGPEDIDFNFLNNLTGGLELEDVNVNLEFKNGIGAQVGVTVKQLSALNSRTGKAIGLSGSITSTPVIVAPAQDNPLTPTYTTIILNKGNSNIKELLEILPDKLQYELEVQLNPNGNISNYNDFVYYESNIEANVNIEVPMAFALNGLTLSDTLELELTAEGLDRIQSGTINLLTENGFPVEAELQFYIINENGTITDSLTTTGQNTVAAGIIDPQTKRVVQPGKTRIGMYVDEAKWQKMKSTRKLLVKARLSTVPPGQILKIYSDSKLKFNLSGDFKYRARF